MLKRTCELRTDSGSIFFETSQRGPVMIDVAKRAIRAIAELSEIPTDNHWKYLMVKYMSPDSVVDDPPYSISSTPDGLADDFEAFPPSIIVDRATNTITHRDVERVGGIGPTEIVEVVD